MRAELTYEVQFCHLLVPSNLSDLWHCKMVRHQLGQCGRCRRKVATLAPFQSFDTFELVQPENNVLLKLGTMSNKLSL